jgi:hypothetical protein
MLGDMRLDKYRGDIRVEPYGKQHRGKLNGVLAEHARLVGDGEGVQVDNAMKHVVVMLPRDPIAESAQIVAQVNVASGLDARKYASHGATLVQVAQRAQDISAL